MEWGNRALFEGKLPKFGRKQGLEHVLVCLVGELVVAMIQKVPGVAGNRMNSY